MSLDVGADIESICGKCGDVWHVVVAKVGDKIAKVLCKQCGGQHRYRPPGGTTTHITKAGRTRSSSRQSAKGKPASNEPLVAADPQRPVRNYALSESYAVGDRISHRTFGTGVVEVLVGQGKIQVFFSGGRRVLAHERSSAAS